MPPKFALIDNPFQQIVNVHWPSAKLTYAMEMLAAVLNGARINSGGGVQMAVVPELPGHFALDTKLTPPLSGHEYSMAILDDAPILWTDTAPGAPHPQNCVTYVHCDNFFARVGPFTGPMDVTIDQGTGGLYWLQATMHNDFHGWPTGNCSYTSTTGLATDGCMGEVYNLFNSDPGPFPSGTYRVSSPYDKNGVLQPGANPNCVYRDPDTNDPVYGKYNVVIRMSSVDSAPSMASLIAADGITNGVWFFFGFPIVYEEGEVRTFWAGNRTVKFTLKAAH